MLRGDIEKHENAQTDSDLFRKVKASIETLDNDSVEAVVPNRTANPDNVKRVEGIIGGASNWDYIFATRHVDYSYTNFLRATAKYPAFCGDYDDGRNADAICRKSLATMFAHFTQETGGHDVNSATPEWRQGLVHLREMGCSETGTGCEYNTECAEGTWQSEVWPCPVGVKYFGRGAKQLSYNYNYGPFSQVMFGDVNVLLQDPDLVARSWLNLSSAVFFFMTPQAPKPSMLHVIDGTWQPNAHDTSLNLEAGFGVTTNIINGGVECGTSSGEEIAQSANRIKYYRGHAENLNVPIAADEVLGCAAMGRFDTEGSGALLINWDQDWGYYQDRPEGKSYACKLVGYQTAFNAFIPGDYEKCLTEFFEVQVQ